MLKNFLYLSLLAILDNCGCGGVMNDIIDYTIYNDSENTISVYIADGTEYNPSAYPDTILPCDRQVGFPPKYISEVLKERSISPHKPIHIISTYNQESSHEKKLYFDTLSVFILSFDTLKKYGYEDVRVHNRIMVRYDLSYDEVRDMNWTFYYPPREFMKDMKMYPPYSEIMKKE